MAVAGGDAAVANNAAQIEMENNYLSSSDRSKLDALSRKPKLTEQEQQEKIALQRKDAESTKVLIEACLGGSDAACNAARKDALQKQGSYQNLTYQNLKEHQAGYQEIEQLLNATTPEAKSMQAVYQGMIASYQRLGMSEEAAKSAVGYQL